MNLKEILLSQPTGHLRAYTNAQEIVDFINDRLPDDLFVSLSFTNNETLYKYILMLDDESKTEVLSKTMLLKVSNDKINAFVVTIVTIVVSFILMLSVLAGAPVNQDGTTQSLVDQIIDAIAQSILNELK